MTKSAELPFLPVETGNHLILIDSKKHETRGRNNDNMFYDEVAFDVAIVTKVHVLHHMNIYPPQRTDQGWKKTDLFVGVIKEGKLQK